MSLKKIAFLLLFAVCGFSNAATTNYNLDPLHTYVEWRISHFGFSYPSGKWMVESGVLNLDEKKITNSSVQAAIQIEDLQTGVQKLDEHLMTNQFFDAAKFPAAIFVSTSVKQKSTNKLIVNGNLTVHGVTKPVTLNVTINKIGMHPVSLHKTAGFSATAKIKRSDFGINAYLPGLGDNVEITIGAEAVLPNESDTKQLKQN